MTEASLNLRQMASNRQSVGEMDTLVAALNSGGQSDPAIQVASAAVSAPAAPIQAAPVVIAGPAKTAPIPPANPNINLAVVPETGSGWYLQAASFNDPANANRARTQLQHVGPIVIVSRARGERTLYLVRVGPYGNKQKAQSALERIRKVGFDDALLVASS